MVDESSITKQVDKSRSDAPKVKKIKTKKRIKNRDEQKSEKAPKEDKLAKLMVSINKSAIKSVKKEAADDGLSVNEYVLSAIEEKLAKSKGKA